MLKFANWLTEAEVTGPIDWAMRKAGSPVAGMANRTAQAVKRAYGQRYPGETLARQRGDTTDWNALAQGISGKTDPQDQANFGFATERNLMDYINKLKRQGQSLAAKTKAMVVGIGKETAAVSYQIVQSPDIVVIQPAKEFARQLAQVCRLIKTKVEPAEQSEDPAQIAQAMKETNDEIAKLVGVSNRFKEALKMLGYGTVLGHWIFALGTYLALTNNLGNFEHWLNSKTYGVGLAALVGYKAFVNALFFSLPALKQKAQDDPNSLVGKIGTIISRALDSITPSSLQHKEEPASDKPETEFGQKAGRYGAYRDEYRKAKKTGQPLPTFDETTAYGLHDSAVRAFPGTTRRQHATDPIRITQMEWVPYKGLNTLYVSGLAQNTEAGTEYRPMVLFKGVRYHDRAAPGFVEIVASDNKPYILERLGQNRNDVVVRCNCNDFKWRFNYYDHLDHSLYGRKRAPYQSQGGPMANPTEMPGMCKHLMVLFKSLTHAGVII